MERVLLSNDIVFEKTIYWKLETISCVLVLRNKYWFCTVLPYIQDFWDRLCYEKDTEKYKERIRKKRKIEYKHNKMFGDFPNSGCLIDPVLFSPEEKLKQEAEKQEKEKQTKEIVFTTEIYK